LARLLEHQGKDIFRRFKIPTPEGKVVRRLEEARAVADEIGYPLVVKAQVYAGRRGKSGGIRIVDDDNELLSAVSEMLSSTVPGLTTDTLLIEEKVDVKQEIYVGITADPGSRKPVAVVCGDGGVDIEETAQHAPDALLKFYVDISRGMQVYDALNLLRDVPGMSSQEKLAVARVICSLYALYRHHDCKLAEINPLALTSDRVVALDARVDIDDDAVSRQADLNIEIAEEAGSRSATVLERIAGSIDRNDHRGTVHFVQIDPDLSYIHEHGLTPVGFDCVGAGASLATMDELVPLGFYPVDFCDTSGNPVGSKLYRITKIIFSQPGIEGYVFVSCISSQQLDNTARGIIKALKEIYAEAGGQPNIPTVLGFRGAWDEDAIKLLADHGISEGRWVRVLGRDATERDVAETFAALHRQWKATGERC
jgi:succinyl-CoA synthetase beta subunit